MPRFISFIRPWFICWLFRTTTRFRLDTVSPSQSAVRSPYKFSFLNPTHSPYVHSHTGIPLIHTSYTRKSEVPTVCDALHCVPVLFVLYNSPRRSLLSNTSHENANFSYMDFSTFSFCILVYH